MLRLVRAVLLTAIIQAGASLGDSGHSGLFPRELQGESEDVLFPVDDPLDNLTSDSNSTLEDSDSSIASEEDLEPTVSSNSSNASGEDLELNVSLEDGKVDADPIGADEGFTLPMEGLEKFYDLLALGSYYLAVFSLACGLVQVPLACFTKDGCHFVPKAVYYAFAMFFGYIYLSYLLTIPLYGLPKSECRLRHPPHLGAPDLGDDLIPKVKKIVVNTIVMIFLPYFLMCWSLMVLGLIVTIPICVLFIVLLLLCRWSACILRCVEPCLADSMKDAARAAKAECNG